MMQCAMKTIFFISLFKISLIGATDQFYEELHRPIQVSEFYKNIGPVIPKPPESKTKKSIRITYLMPKLINHMEKLIKMSFEDEKFNNREISYLIESVLNGILTIPRWIHDSHETYKNNEINDSFKLLINSYKNIGHDFFAPFPEKITLSHPLVQTLFSKDFQSQFMRFNELDPNKDEFIVHDLIHLFYKELKELHPNLLVTTPAIVENDINYEQHNHEKLVREKEPEIFSTDFKFEQLRLRNKALSKELNDSQHLNEVDDNNIEEYIDCDEIESTMVSTNLSKGKVKPPSKLLPADSCITKKDAFHSGAKIGSASFLMYRVKDYLAALFKKRPYPRSGKVAYMVDLTRNEARQIYSNINRLQHKLNKLWHQFIKSSGLSGKDRCYQISNEKRMNN